MKIITMQPADNESKEAKYLFSVDGKPMCPIGSVNLLIMDDGGEVSDNKQDKNNERRI